MKLADPIDAAVARAWGRSEPDRCHPVLRNPHGSEMLAAAMRAEAAGLDPLVEEVAVAIFEFDQESVNKPWRALSSICRKPYYDIALAVIPIVRRAG